MKRNKRVSVYLNDDEVKMLDYICEAGFSKSAAIRIMIKATASDCFTIPSDKTDIFNKIYDKELGVSYEREHF